MTETLIQEKQQKITVEELFDMELDDDFYYELINGNIVKKQAPSPFHQKAVLKIAKLMDNLAEEKELGSVFTSPIDVFFDTHNKAQPDILFIKKDRDFIITKDGIQGQPDLIVEVLSPSTMKYDRSDKFKLYLEFGVSEYWIVDTKNQSVEVYTLENDSYEMTFFAIEEGDIESKVLTGLKFPVELIF
jgi:Uma2 family endonuclease